MIIANCPKAKSGRKEAWDRLMAKAGMKTARVKTYTKQEIADLIFAARIGELPEGFSDWGLNLARKGGWSVAHEAASRMNLPKGFDEWHIADSNGVTVAHVAVMRCPMPKDFDGWDLADRIGRTVAHIAAAWRRLPKDFDRWDLRMTSGEHEGRTVAHTAALSGTLPLDIPEDVLLWGSKYDGTVADCVIRRYTDDRRRSKKLYERVVALLNSDRRK
jgi:hypothetical protein